MLPSARFETGHWLMRTPLYDRNAERRTVSLTLNADLVAKSAALGIDISDVAEAALIAAFETAESAQIRDDRTRALDGIFFGI